MKKSAGFTLIELMIVIAIVSILLAIGIPAYNDQMRKSRRSEAKQLLSDLVLKQEKWRSNHATYGTMTQIGGAASIASDSGYYTVGAVTLPAATGTCAAPSTSNSYVITATAAGTQASDTRCATMVITNTCGVQTKTSTPSGNVCW